MQRILSASLGAALFSYAVMATAVAAPNTPNPPTWTGFYVGGNIGYSWGEASADIAGDAIFASTSGVLLGGLPWRTPFAASERARLEGVIGGGQIGYNYQFNRFWLFGIEADLQASRERGSSSPAAILSDSAPTGFIFDATSGQFSFVFSPLAGTALTNYEAKIDWFGTLRARVGFLLNDALAIYGTGGLAYGHVALSGSMNANATVGSNPILLFSGTTAFSAAKTNVGYSVGAGIEGAFWLPEKWRWKAEYLYIDLGSLSAAAQSITTHAHFVDHILRVGVNYGF